jgi:uncharacterized protein (DUF342 family)
MAEKYRIIEQRQGDDCDLIVRVNEDETECLITIEPKGPAIGLADVVLLDILEKGGVSHGIDMEAISESCEAANSGNRVDNKLIAKGALPKEGSDGYLELCPGTSSEDSGFSQDEQGKVDLREGRIFDIVREGQPAAMLHKAKQGKEGYSVTGDARPAPEVKDVSVSPGVGIKLLGDDRTFVATMNGQVLFNNGVVSVSDKLLIEENVDYETGHIDFPGYVEVKGDVLEEFSLRATTGIKIHGNVEASIIESDGDIELRGMAGKEGRGSIKCGGALSAQHLDGVTVECEGDIYVKKEVMLSTIHCASSIVVTGLIAGGKCIAMKGIEAAKAGTQIDVETYLRSGVDYRLVTQIAEMEKALGSVQEALQKAIDMLGPYARHDNPAAFTEQIKKRVREMAAEIEELKEKEKKLKQGLKSVQDEGSERANAKINITQELHSGVVIHLGNTVEKTGEVRSGSCSIIEHLGTELRFLDKTSLATNAREIEKKLIEKEETEEKKRIEREQAEEKRRLEREKIEEKRQLEREKAVKKKVMEKEKAEEKRRLEREKAEG